MRKKQTYRELKSEIDRLTEENSQLKSQLSYNDELIELNKKLIQSNQKYLNLVNNTGTAICIFDENETITLCNSIFEELSGYKRSEIENNKKWTDFFPQNEIARLENYKYQKVEINAPLESDFIFLAKNQHSFVNVKISSIAGSSEWIGSITDITDRKKAEVALMKSEMEKRAFLNTLPHLAWLKDLEGRYVSVNDSFAKSRERKVDDIIGKTDFDLYSKKIAEKYIKEDHLIIQTGKPWFFEEKTDTKWFETFKSPLFDKNGLVIGVTGVSLEITERKKAEEEIREYSKKLAEQNEALQLVNNELIKSKEKAEESDRLKSAFLANMSHEIRTPMNAILGFADLLKFRKLTEERKKAFIDIINSKSKQLLQIITDIIDISKIEADQIKISRKNFSLNELIRQLIIYFNTLKEQERKTIDIKVNYGLSDKNSWIYSDKVRIEQILTNLMSNAYKFTEKGEIEIGYRIDKDGGLVFHVRDTGIGLNEEEKKIIFDRFRQANSTFNRIYGGTGLGLSISKGLVEKMNGSIWVESTVNQGSVFYVRIPYDAGEKVISFFSGKKEVYSWENKVILVAEDEDINYNFIETLLQPTKAALIRAINGNEAIELCKRNPSINLVLMDIKLPGLNGLEATREIKKFRKTLPVIAQTAYAMSSDEESCLNAGCDAYISKPIKIEPFMKLIQQFL